MRCSLPLAALAAAAYFQVGAHADDVGKTKTDPVSLKPVTVAKETPSVIVNGAPLYFADAKSREAFLKAPETYLKTPLDCPVKGLKGRANKANRVVVNDQILYFCCAGCPQEYAKEPGSFTAKLRDPVSGKEMSASADSPKSIYKGGTYYFESEETKAQFDKEPVKFAKVVLQ